MGLKLLFASMAIFSFIILFGCVQETGSLAKQRCEQTGGTFIPSLGANFPSCECPEGKSFDYGRGCVGEKVNEMKIACEKAGGNYIPAPPCPPCPDYGILPIACADCEDARCECPGQNQSFSMELGCADSSFVWLKYYCNKTNGTLEYTPGQFDSARCDCGSGRTYTRTGCVAREEPERDGKSLCERTGGNMVYPSCPPGFDGPCGPFCDCGEEKAYSVVGCIPQELREECDRKFELCRQTGGTPEESAPPQYMPCREGVQCPPRPKISCGCRCPAQLEFNSTLGCIERESSVRMKTLCDETGGTYRPPPEFSRSHDGFCDCPGNKSYVYSMGCFQVNCTGTPYPGPNGTISCIAPGRCYDWGCVN